MRNGTPLGMQLRAKPTSKKARYPCATVTVTFGVEGDECPRIGLSEDIAHAYRALTGTPLMDVYRERAKQISKGFNAAHDDAHMNPRALPLAAAALAVAGLPGLPLSWLESSPEWVKDIIRRHGDRERLVKAAAFLVAEIERIDRASGQPHP